MKILKVKSILFSLLAVLMVSVFMISCEQEAIITDQIEDLSPEMIMQDADVIAFIVAYNKAKSAMDEKIQANQAAFDRYIAAEDFGAIRELLNYDVDILPLANIVDEKREVVLEKYPNITEVGGITIKYELEEVNSRGCWSAYVGCSWGCSATTNPQACYNNCYWIWCTSGGF